MKKYNSFDEYLDSLTPKEKETNAIIVLIISLIFILAGIIGALTS